MRPSSSGSIQRNLGGLDRQDYWLLLSGSAEGRVNAMPAAVPPAAAATMITTAVVFPPKAAKKGLSEHGELPSAIVPVTASTERRLRHQSASGSSQSRDLARKTKD